MNTKPRIVEVRQNVLKHNDEVARFGSASRMQGCSSFERSLAGSGIEVRILDWYYKS